MRPRYVERSFKPVIGREAIKVKLHIARSENGLRSFVFSYHDMLETPSDQQSINGALEGAMRGSLATVNGQLLALPDEVIYQGAHARQFRYEFEQGEKKYEVVSRVFLVKQRQYQLSVIMAKEDWSLAEAQYFLDSFRIVVPEPDLPPEPRLNR